MRAQASSIGCSREECAYGDACRLANVVNSVKLVLDQSLLSFEYKLGRGPKGRLAEGMSFSKGQFATIFNDVPIPSIRDPAILKTGLGPSDASVVSAGLQPSHQSGQECKQQ